MLDAYLERLGFASRPAPTLEALAALHAAHLQRVPYENVEIQLGRVVPVDPAVCADRVVRLRAGGYCFHLNAAFSFLLRGLGFIVEWRRGTVTAAADDSGATHLNHLVLFVRDLAGRDWWADAGLGDGFLEPLPLPDADVDDGPFRFVVSASPLYAGGVRVLQLPTGAFERCDVDAVTPSMAELAAANHRLSTSHDSGFVKTFTVQRRVAAGADILRACTLTHVRAGDTRSVRLDSFGAWRAALHDVFGLDLSYLPASDRARLFERALAQHREWEEIRKGRR